MPFSVLMQVEGVLSDDLVDFPGAPPLPEGVLLFHGLASVFAVTLSSAAEDYAGVERFLHYGCGIKPTTWANVWIAEEGETEREAHLRHLTFAQSSGMACRYFVTPDPWLARMSVLRGITPLCCPHPSYSRPSFLPDAGQGRKEWDQIEAEVMNGRLLKGRDARLSVEDYAEEEDELL